MGGRKGGNSVSYSLAASCFRISRFFCVRFASALRFALLGALFHFLIFFLFCVFEAIVSSPLENRVKLLPATQPIVKRQVQYGKVEYWRQETKGQSFFLPLAVPQIECNAGCKRGIQRFDAALHGNGERFQVTEFRWKSRAFKARQKAEALRKFE
jgi:hypothetical protein